MAVELVWTDLNASEDGHRVYRSASPIQDDALPAPLAELGPDETGYVDTTAVVGEVYYYRVSAFKGAVESLSVEIQITAT
ncbi:hypothetical protein CFI10_07055 [Marinobacterium iners]|uniref:hypothetical protein n=1 Tax=Marinobacterium iners TaxID=48076 RepID=UPI001A8FAD0E|nr:hypothetical protein [Marinobacterium iners]QSR34755.1 hypothetical protein CFI10_07055 [Marinobacterium iners]